ncbi:disulfide bond formation protein DsbA [Saccharomonospora sp. NPDC006951]
MTTSAVWVTDFWLDPACPLTRVTARWLRAVAGEVPLDIRWRVMSLSILNEDKDIDPEGDEDGFLWIPARIAAAVQTGHGHAALGEFHTALWTEPDGTEREWFGDIADALRRCGLPESLVESGSSTEYDAELRASHDEGVGRIHAEVGTPILSITTPEGARYTTFGPVITSVPGGAGALDLWHATLRLAALPEFREIKIGR